MGAEKTKKGCGAVGCDAMGCDGMACDPVGCGPLTRAERRRADRSKVKEGTETYLKGVMGKNYTPPRHVPYFRNGKGLKRRLRDQEKIMKEHLKKEGKTDEEIEKAIQAMYNQSL